MSHLGLGLLSGHVTVANDVIKVAQLLDEGDWGAAFLQSGATTITFVGVVGDPLGTLLSHLGAEVLDKVEPLRGWLQELTGDRDRVMAAAQVVEAEGELLLSLADDVRRGMVATLDGMEGLAVETGAEQCRLLVADLEAAATAAGSVARALDVAAGYVSVMHSLVRDALAEVAGMVMQRMIVLGLTAGAATPVVLAEVTTRIAVLAARLRVPLRAVVTTCEALRRLLDDLDVLLLRMRRSLDDRLDGPALGPRRAATVGAGAVFDGLATDATADDPVGCVP
ncbi:hypothetical protein [Nocardioides daphniae]|uniref:WXG100 family type VII secretion target n=1 Tax=Nocardioides daphniae TaxID=402297 RepID=A0A4P7UHK5_9ACTN|nr:hypothetical protein [Nocardioides daphniae]QCC78129.1 hypothetical protein E2C04_14760 [Nocardioides daphniae]GGD21677.1 hypothetical protein GCM10007231_21100 [Nocardioides daphniae]